MSRTHHWRLRRKRQKREGIRRNKQVNHLWISHPLLARGDLPTCGDEARGRSTFLPNLGSFSDSLARSNTQIGCVVSVRFRIPAMVLKASPGSPPAISSRFVQHFIHTECPETTGQHRPFSREQAAMLSSPHSPTLS